MEIVVKGYLNFEHNPDLINDKSWNDVKHIYIKILDKEDRDKIKNVMNNWKNSENLHKPISSASDGGMLLRINTQKINKYLGLKMVKTPVSEWFNKMYVVRFSLRKYSFKNIYTKEVKMICGINFILKNIDLFI